MAQKYIPNHYPEQKNELHSFLTVMVGKFKISAQDSDLEYFLELHQTF